MPSIPITDIYAYARGVGLSVAGATVATAIALAESGGNPNSRCHNCFPGVTEDSRGLWQINIDAHPDMADWNLYDPATNAKAMYLISGRGTSFRAWSTYTSGAYLSRLPNVTSALGGADPSRPVGPPQSSSGGYDDVPPPQVAPPPGSSSSSGGVEDASSTSILDLLNPLHWLQKGASAAGNAAGDATAAAGTAVWNEVKPFLLKLTVGVLGLALIGAGVIYAVKPAAERAASAGDGGGSLPIPPEV